MNVIINPGSGPVAKATEAEAETNIQAFIADLRASGLHATGYSRESKADYGDGRYAFAITFAEGRAVEIQMPGLPLDRVRWIDAADQDIWDFPRLYVDDSSWVWKFALSVCGPDEDE